ncbi:hypothetical protein PUN28_017194 [Cardiocondyla obscurior]|uniref:Uncharacterized protein n=1 Tax=Cardiocondyla obscurior TaxID=286306 RepID=A0AAW2EPM3_9HYME
MSYYDGTNSLPRLRHDRHGSFLLFDRTPGASMTRMTKYENSSPPLLHFYVVRGVTRMKMGNRGSRRTLISISIYADCRVTVIGLTRHSRVVL